MAKHSPVGPMRGWIWRVYILGRVSSTVKDILVFPIFLLDSFIQLQSVKPVESFSVSVTRSRLSAKSLSWLTDDQ